MVGDKKEPTEKTEYINRTDLPPAPPNYRGMLYGAAESEKNTNAEGIERLVREDEGYSAYEKNRIRREFMSRRENTPAFSHFSPPMPSDAPKNKDNSLKKLIEGLQNKMFLPEDVLICAMIILMLNSKSEDDVLMVLVLMMLL